MNRRPPKKKAETLLHERIIGTINQIPGVLAERQHVGGVSIQGRRMSFGKAGQLDVRVIFAGGGYGEWEVKTPAAVGRFGGNPLKALRPEQRARVDRLAMMGVPTGVWSSVDAAVASIMSARQRFGVRT